MNSKLKIIYTFKDAHRYYWRIIIWCSGETTNGDLEWAYIIERESTGTPDGFGEVYHGGITGQGDEEPRVDNILHDYLSYVARVALDGARHAERG